MNSYKNKTILITGASNGIGKAFAEQLATQGAKLILTARSEKKLQELAKRLSNDHSTMTDVVVGDLSLPETPQRLFNEIESKNLDVDVVINNAGFGKWGPFHSVDYQTYQQMCALNINAVIALTHLFLPAMLKKKDGGFINVASTAGFQPIPFFATYSATKSFVLNFSEALWKEYKDDGITITCLCPGGTQSGFHQVSNMEKSKLVGFETPEKVAKLGLKAFLQGKLTVISGFKNYLLANSTRFGTRKRVTAITAAMFKPTRN